MRLSLVAAIVIAVCVMIGFHPASATAAANSEGRAVAALQPGPRTGPGIGDSKETPGGAPITLALPPGYTLDSIHGDSSEAYDDACYDFDPADPPAVCRYSYGLFTATLTLCFDPTRYVAGRDSNRDQCRSDPATAPEPFSGWLLVSEDGEAQNIWLTTDVCTTRDGRVTPVLDLPAPPAGTLASRGISTVLFTVAGHCVNLSRHVPGDEHTFGVGVATNEPGLRQIWQIIRNKNLYSEESQSIIQDIVWDYSDIDGVTREDVSRLNALP